MLGLVASSLDLPVTRTRTENELRRTGLPVTHAEDELATVDTVGGPAKGRRLLVGGVGMTSLTVDTKLMGYLSKALRPEAQDFLVIAFGMGGTYRSGLQLGLRTDAVELSPTVPSRMPVFFPDADRFLDHPQGRVIVSDGRNYVRLSRETYDMIAVDPAPPIESAGSVVLYTREFLTEGKARLRPGGVFMLWIPYALPLDDFKEHVRTFAGVFGHVRLVLSPGRHGVFMFGSDAPLEFTEPNIRQVLGAPAALRDLNDVPDHPRHRRRRLGRGRPPFPVAGRRPAALLHRLRPPDHRRPPPLRVLPLAPRPHGRPAVHQRVQPAPGRSRLRRRQPSVWVTLSRPRGASGSRPLALARASTRSWPGTISANGARCSGSEGPGRADRQAAANSWSPPMP